MTARLSNSRTLLAALCLLPLAACKSTAPGSMAALDDESAWYIGTMPDKPHDVPLVDTSRLDPKYRRQEVAYAGPEAPGTIVVDIDKRQLALVQEGGVRSSTGSASASSASRGRGGARGPQGVWPDWTPTTTMVSLNPDIDRSRKGGVDNPLGARALYLYQGSRDTLFRIHGTNEPWSIGEQMSSGCVRMLNEDIVDLYERVPVGTRVLVKRGGKYRA
ncbi:L,D-transpeptidase [Methylorubrum suomiense]